MFKLLEPKSFTREEVENQLVQLMKICILRLEHNLPKEASIAPHSLTFSSLLKSLNEYVERDHELHSRITREFGLLLEEYLKEVTGVKDDGKPSESL